MPFVPKSNRENLANGGTPQTVGDICYQHYLQLMTAWKKERRWTTVHEQFKQVFDVDDNQAAKTLAFLVFMMDEVYKYELEKKEENGSI